MDMLKGNSMNFHAQGEHFELISIVLLLESPIKANHAPEAHVTIYCLCRLYLKQTESIHFTSVQGSHSAQRPSIAII